METRGVDYFDQRGVDGFVFLAMKKAELKLNDHFYGKNSKADAKQN